MPPLPDPKRRRRNAPTIPTTALPASGRKGTPPKPPHGSSLGEAGATWWRWSWRTPQACGWAKGHESLVGRRAWLEDEVVRIGDLLGRDDLTMADIRGLTNNRLAVFREMRELDDRLGLSPKGMAQLRWEIVSDSAPAEVEDAPEPDLVGEIEPPKADEIGARRKRRAGMLDA